MGFVKFLKWLVFTVLGIIAGFLIIPLIGPQMDGMGAAKRAMWLIDNSVFQGDEITSMELGFPDEFYDNQVYLFGEIHGYATPQQVDLTLLKHLNQKTGLRLYLAEIDPAQAIAFNYYLESGNDTFAKEVFDLWAEQEAQWANKEFFEKLTQLREYNLTLKASNRIRFVGVDQLHNNDFALKVLDFQWPVSNLPWSRQVYSLNFSLLNSALSPVETNPSRYTSIMGNIEMVLNRQGFQEEQYYGLWGDFHSYKTLVNEGIKPLAYRLGEIAQLQGKVVNLTALYGPGSFAMMPSAALPEVLIPPSGEPYVLIPMGSDNPYLHYLSGLKDLKTAANGNSINIFNIDGPESPYMEGKRLIEYSGAYALADGLTLEGTASDALDYVVYFEGAAPLTPWQGDAYDFRTEE